MFYMNPIYIYIYNFLSLVRYTLYIWIKYKENGIIYIYTYCTINTERYNIFPIYVYPIYRYICFVYVENIKPSHYNFPKPNFMCVLIHWYIERYTRCYTYVMKNDTSIHTTQHTIFILSTPQNISVLIIQHLKLVAYIFIVHVFCTYTAFIYTENI